MTTVDRPFGRLLAALLTPGSGPEAALAAYQGTLAAVEFPEEGAGVVLLDHAGASPDELRARLEAVLKAHQAGALILVVVGGGAAAREALAAADRAAPDPNKVGAYHLEGGELLRVAGRRLRVLERAAGRLADVQPLEAADVPALVARARREREEAALFAHALEGRKPWATWIIIAACILLHGLFSRWQTDLGVNHGPSVRDGQVWRLLSSVFLHGSLVHLLMNMFVLYSFGKFLESLLGWRRYVVLYALGGLGGSLASAFLATRYAAGASGAIWALMAFGFGLVSSRQSVIPSAVAGRLRRGLTQTLLLNIGISFLPGIDLWAHGGGGAVGLLLGRSGLLTPRPAPAGQPPPVGDPAALRLGAAVAVAALVVSVALGVLWGRPSAELGV